MKWTLDDLKAMLKKGTIYPTSEVALIEELIDLKRYAVDLELDRSQWRDVVSKIREETKEATNTVEVLNGKCADLSRELAQRTTERDEAIAKLATSAQNVRDRIIETMEYFLDQSIQNLISDLKDQVK